jgi:hypothetical protein
MFDGNGAQHSLERYGNSQAKTPSIGGQPVSLNDSNNFPSNAA